MNEHVYTVSQYTYLELPTTSSPVHTKETGKDWPLEEPQVDVVEDDGAKPGLHVGIEALTELLPLAQVDEPPESSEEDPRQLPLPSGSRPCPVQLVMALSCVCVCTSALCIVAMAVWLEDMTVARAVVRAATEVAKLLSAVMARSFSPEKSPARLPSMPKARICSEVSAVMARVRSNATLAPRLPSAPRARVVSVVSALVTVSTRKLTAATIFTALLI